MNPTMMVIRENMDPIAPKRCTHIHNQPHVQRSVADASPTPCRITIIAGRPPRLMSRSWPRMARCTLGSLNIHKLAHSLARTAFCQ